MSVLKIKKMIYGDIAEIYDFILNLKEKCKKKASLKRFLKNIHKTIEKINEEESKIAKKVILEIYSNLLEKENEIKCLDNLRQVFLEIGILFVTEDNKDKFFEIMKENMLKFTDEKILEFNIEQGKKIGIKGIEFNLYKNKEDRKQKWRKIKNIDELLDKILEGR